MRTPASTTDTSFSARLHRLPSSSPALQLSRLLLPPLWTLLLLLLLMQLLLL
jgi:hypothetical protein